MDKVLPDIAKSISTSPHLTLDWVGMGAVEGSVLVEGSRVPCDIDVYVDLIDPKSKGIHMSRLYLASAEELQSEELNFRQINDLLVRLVEEQGGLSSQSRLRLDFKLPLMRKALVSNTEGERHYPITIEAYAGKNESGQGYEFDLKVEFKLLYSSTCPCSAALSRQLVESNWKKFASSQDSIDAGVVSDWLKKESSIVATPHAQRSEAHVKVSPRNEFRISDLKDWVDSIENLVLKTPVQTAVKREDEQEFARLNGTNLMFCEDAARKLGVWLGDQAVFSKYWARVEHQESLHSHNAVSEISNEWS